MRYAWIEIDLDAIKNNIKQMRKLVGSARICTVIKANACGHGAAQIAPTLLNNGADMIGVANLDEALSLRQSGVVAPILIVGFTPVSDYEDVVFNNIIQTIYSYEQASKLNAVACKMKHKVKVHLKIDVGMSRIGFLDDNTLLDQIKQIIALNYVEIEGIFMHPPMADTDQKEIAKQQLSRFLDIVDEIKQQCQLDNIYIHASNSASLIDIKDSRLNMVRTGASVYGYYSSDSVSRDVVKLQPAMQVKARIIQLKLVEANTPIGYGASYITDKQTLVATIPIGFGDGYWKALATKADVLIHGKRHPIIGKIAMDMFMVDVSSIPDVKEGDEVVLIGQQEQTSLWADEVAKLANGYEFELMCHLGLRLKKYYVK